MIAFIQTCLLFNLVAGAIGSAQYFFSKINGTCQASNQINQGDNLGDMCAYLPDVNRVYSCPAGEGNCWTYNQRCAAGSNVAGDNQLSCGTWCCDSRYEECTKNPNQINICVAIIQKVPNPLSGFALGTPGASAATAVDSQFTSTASSSATTSSSSRTSSSPASAAGTSISPTATPTPEASKRNSLSGGAIAGATIGALIGAALIGLGAFWLGKHFTERKNRQTVKSQHQVGENPLAVEAPPHDSHRHGSYDHGPYQKRFTPEPIREIGEPTVRPSELAAPPSAYKR